MRFDADQRCDIVIPTWNNQEMLKECVDSIEKHTAYTHRIVIVDNASDAPTRQYLDSLKAALKEKVVIIRNDENKGFVKAVNQGMKFSDAPYVCVMNNDTVATDEWLEEIIDILVRNEDIGLINPSSNSSCQFPGDMDIDLYAGALKKFRGKYQELYTCRAFSMVAKRSVIEKIGYLDENYGMGYFDDADYSKRAQAAGYKTVRAKASYVYHKESQSFSKIKEKVRIFQENERKFISKWGRQLRVAYVIPYIDDVEKNRISSNINDIAKMGHQVWIFTKYGLKERLDLIDHESIRFLLYPGLFFGLTALYKIRKRKRNKKLHVILTNSPYLAGFFGRFSGTLNAGVYSDENSPYLKKELTEISSSSRFE